MKTACEGGEEQKWKRTPPAKGGAVEIRIQALWFIYNTGAGIPDPRRYVLSLSILHGGKIPIMN